MHYMYIASLHKPLPPFQSSTIVNLTNVEESGKIRGLIYWPHYGSTMTYGNIAISSLNDKSCDGYTMHTLEISNLNEVMRN